MEYSGKKSLMYQRSTYLDACLNQSHLTFSCLPMLILPKLLLHSMRCDATLSLSLCLFIILLHNTVNFALLDIKFVHSTSIPFPSIIIIIMFVSSSLLVWCSVWNKEHKMKISESVFFSLEKSATFNHGDDHGTFISDNTISTHLNVFNIPKCSTLTSKFPRSEISAEDNFCSVWKNGSGKLNKKSASIELSVLNESFFNVTSIRNAERHWVTAINDTIDSLGTVFTAYMYIFNIFQHTVNISIHDIS